jgi:hypothetical protein
MKLNNLNSETIYSGENLIVYYYGNWLLGELDRVY